MKTIATKLAVCLMLVVPVIGYTSAQAQQHEVSAQAGFGLSTLNYDVANGSSKGRVGFNVGVGYTYFLSEQWGVSAGLDLSFYNGKATLGNITSAYQTVDNEKDNVQYRSAFGTYEETQQAMFLNIPVMAQFQHPVMETAKFYAQAGVKVGIPVSGKFKAADATYTTTGYFPAYNIEVANSPSGGFGTYEGKSVKNDLDLKLSFALAAEAGLKWSLAENMSLYTGLYLDYGLTNVVKSKDNVALVEYDEQFKPAYGSNSALVSQYLRDGKPASMGDKALPFAVGLRLRFAFAL